MLFQVERQQLDVRLLLFLGLVIVVHPSLAISTAKPTSSLVQFAFQEVTASELQQVVDVPIERTGTDLESYLSVRCVTSHQSAGAGSDYIERADEPNSAVVFLPGERTKSCGVRLLDDADFEHTETFLVHLKNLRNVDSSEHSVRLGPNCTVLVRIIDDEDAPTVEFQTSRHRIDVERIRESSSSNHNDVTASLLAVIRTGVDQNHTSKVRVRTLDEASAIARSLLDYRSINKVLTFRPGERVQLVEIDILAARLSANSAESTFKVYLVDDQDLVNAKLGGVKSVQVTVILKSQEELELKSPLVTSLPYYVDPDAIGQFKSRPHQLPAGYPLICVTPCEDPHYYAGFKKSSCGLNETSSSSTAVTYAWEVALPADDDVDRSVRVFKRLSNSIIFARVDARVLDSIHFRPGFWVRCVTQPMTQDVLGHGLIATGQPTTSPATLIDPAAGGFCGSGGLNHVQGLQTESFTATLKYSSGAHADHAKHANRLHVHVEIPHQDGLLPLVSTRPLHNPATLLLDPANSVHRSREHPCSNLLMPGDRDATLNDGFLKQDDFLEGSISVDDLYRHELDATLRSNETLLLYRHLNRKRCRWTFDAWYHMAELVDVCGGYTFVDQWAAAPFNSPNGGQTVTVRVPLYVSYVFVSPHPTGWTTIERHTEMEFSFEYNSVVWNSEGGAVRSPLQTDRKLGGRVHVQRISIGETGKMVIDFHTTPNFRGLFVTKHQDLGGHESRLLPPSNLILSFDLRLLWTARTYDGPTQTWRAVSNYSLKDYSGTYVLELMPCTSFDRTFDDDDDQADGLHLHCTPHPPRRFEMPVEFQQTNRPVAVVYSLNTHFELTNDERAFLSPPSINDADHEHTNWAFSKGETVLGRVLWHPEQDLQRAYRLIVQRVYACTGQGYYVPVYDPTGDEYDEGPQFGCIRPSKRLGHRIVLLDRTNNLPRVAAGHDHLANTFEAKFAEDVPKYREIVDMPGVDGFVVPVDNLYRIEAGQRWFLQVVYTIEPSLELDDGRGRRRTTRSVATARNGTNMRSLWLNKNGDQPERNSSSTSSMTYVQPIVGLILFVVAIGVVVVLLGHSTLKRLSPSETCRRQDNVDGLHGHETALTPSMTSSLHVSCKCMHRRPSRNFIDDIEGTEV